MSLCTLNATCRSHTRVYYTISKPLICSAFLHDYLSSNLAKDFCHLGGKTSLTDIDYSHGKGNAIKRMAEIHTINAVLLRKTLFRAFACSSETHGKPFTVLAEIKQARGGCLLCLPFLRKALCRVTR